MCRGMCLSVVILLAACAEDPAEAGPTVDVRIDLAGSAADSDAVSPRACYDGERVYVAWEEDREGRPGIWYNRSEDGGATWLLGATPVDGGDIGATRPTLACAGGRVWVAWEDARDGELQNRNIYLNRSEDGGETWLADDLPLDDDPGGAAMSLGPELAVAEEGVYLTWFDGRDGAYDILLRASTDGGATWGGGPVRVDSDVAGAAWSGWPRLVAGAGGRVVVAWEDTRGGGTDIYAARSTDHGATFAEDARLDGDAPGAADSFRPRIAADGEAVFVTWHDEREGDARDVYLAWSDDFGGRWEEAIRAEADAPGLFDSVNADVAASSGRAQVVWQDDRSGGYDVYHRVFDVEARGWRHGDLRLDTDTPGEAHSSHPRVHARGQDVLVVWLDYRADAGAVGFNDLFYNHSRDLGDHWTADDHRINSNEPGTSYAVDPAIGLLGDRYGVVWTDGRLGTADLYFASRELGANSVWVAPAAEEVP